MLFFQDTDLSFPPLKARIKETSVSMAVLTAAPPGAAQNDMHPVGDQTPYCVWKARLPGCAPQNGEEPDGLDRLTRNVEVVRGQSWAWTCPPGSGERTPTSVLERCLQGQGKGPRYDF